MMRAFLYSIIISCILLPGILKAQISPNDLVDSISHTWEETSMSHSRLITFKQEGTFTTIFLLDKDMEINGRYWLFDTPEEASVIFQEMVESEQITGTLNSENKIAEYMEQGKHPDHGTHHGFIMEHVYKNGIEEWTVGVWKITKNKLFMKEGCSNASPLGVFYFRAKKFEEWE
jgi:hypothetical protein